MWWEDGASMSFPVPETDFAPCRPFFLHSRSGATLRDPALASYMKQPKSSADSTSGVFYIMVNLMARRSRDSRSCNLKRTFALGCPFSPASPKLHPTILH